MVDSFIVRDSGKREEFEGGMVRDVTDDKVDFTLALDGPMFRRYAAHLSKGAKKYTREVHLTIGNWYGIVASCTCQKPVLIPTSLGETPDSVDPAMKRSFDSVIQSLQNGSEKTVASGQTETEPGNERLVGPTTSQGDTEQSSLLDSGSHQLMRFQTAKSVDVPAKEDPSSWITVTQRAFLEVFCASNVTSLLVTSKTIQTYLNGHSSTCGIRPCWVKGDRIVLPGKRNWMLAQGRQELERFKESAMRHMLQWLAGDIDEDHASAVIFNLNGAEYVKSKL